MNPNPSNPSEEDPLRRHSYDGIQEYDKRLPNWWLATFYGAIVFAIGYWIYYQQSGIPAQPSKALEAELSRIQSEKLLSGAGTLSDETLWQMSRNTVLVGSGEKTFSTTCASCHGEKLTGGIGPNLVDQTWLHGGRPTDLISTVTNGVPMKGMPTWGPVLGAKKISEVVAFILSKHQIGEAGMTVPTRTETDPRVAATERK